MFPHHHHNIEQNMDIIKHILREDFFLDEGDVTEEDRPHLERLMLEYDPVAPSSVPEHIRRLFCVLRVDDAYFYCYRSLVQSIREGHNTRIEVMPRDTAVDTVHTQADLTQCLNVKNIIDHVI